MPALPCAIFAVLLACAGGISAQPQDSQPAPASQPAEVVRVVRGAAVEGGRTMADALNPRAVIQNPAYRGWHAWGMGTRVVARLDEIDAQGRVSPLQRYVVVLEGLDGERASVVQYRVLPDGTVGEPARQAHAAQVERGQIMLARSSPRMRYWRRYEARVALEKAVEATTRPATRVTRRARREEARRAVAAEPPEALPAEFDCAIIETVHVVLADDVPTPEDPAAAPPGTELLVYRSYHNVDAPGWELMLETYRARLGDDGFAADLELTYRWRIESIIRPGEPDPTPEQLKRGLRLDR